MAYLSKVTRDELEHKQNVALESADVIRNCHDPEPAELWEAAEYEAIAKSIAIVLANPTRANLASQDPAIGELSNAIEIASDNYAAASPDEKRDLNFFIKAILDDIEKPTEFKR